MRSLALVSLPLLAGAQARAADWIVDASGVASPLTSISQAMALVASGDRILVAPGSYPPFHFSRSVDVVGLGTEPADVVIARVDFHPTIPTLGWDCGLSNVRVAGDAYAISGNELAPGTFVVDGVQLEGGVFLHGAGSFYLLVQNSRVIPRAGDGFLNAAFDFGGGVADIVTSTIRGGDADAETGWPAGIGLRVWPNATARVSSSIIRGGSGDVSTGNDSGGAAIAGFGGPASLRVSGGSEVHGGDGSGPNGRGGPAVDLAGSLRLGSANVVGGSGATPGAAWAADAPLVLGYDPCLALSPNLRDAAGSAFLRPGDFVGLRASAWLPSASLHASTALDTPSSAEGSPLVAALPTGTSSEAFGVPVRLHRVANPPPRARAYVQAIFVDPHDGSTQTTNPVALAVDP